MLAKYDAETTRQLNELRAESMEIGSRYRNAKQVAADLKKEHEVSLVKIGDAIDERQKYRGHPPKAHQPTILDLPAVTTSTAPSPTAYSIPPGSAPADNTKALPAPAAASGWFPEDIYKKFPLSEWKLSEKDLERLATGKAKRGQSFQPIHTVGDLQAFVMPNPGDPSYTRNYGDIEGIGASGATRIADAEDAFWAYWKKPQKTADETTNGKTGEEIFAYKLGYRPEFDGPQKPAEVKQDGDSEKPTAGNGSGDAGEPGQPGTDGTTPADATEPAKKPGKRKPAVPKLRGGTNGKPIKFKKPKSGTAEERDAKQAAEEA